MLYVVIDPGHGGKKDPGAVGKNGLLEKDVVLEIGKSVYITLNNLFEKDEIQAICTRTSDTFLSLSERVDIAQKFHNKAKRKNYLCNVIFVSIHCNGAESLSARGIETYHFTGSLWGRLLSKRVQESLTWFFPNNINRGVKNNTSFFVLRNTPMPASLVEVEFITNKEKEEQMLTFDFLSKASTSICKGIIDYKKLRKA